MIEQICKDLIFAIAPQNVYRLITSITIHVRYTSRSIPVFVFFFISCFHFSDQKIFRLSSLKITFLMTPQNSKRNVILWKIQLNWRIYGRFIAELNYQILKIESKTFDILEHWAVILCASKKNVQWRPKDAWMMLKITNMCLGQWFRNGIRGLKMEWLIFWVLLIWWGGGAYSPNLAPMDFGFRFISLNTDMKVHFTGGFNDINLNTAK